MGMKCSCPACGHNFRVHGYERQTKCYECDRLFNPQQNKGWS